jgi:hypothetical protein
MNSTHMTYQYAGYAAEAQLQSALSESQRFLKIQHFSHQQILFAIRATQKASYRLQRSFNRYAPIYGDNHGSNYTLNWEDVPASLLIDEILSLDYVVNYKGYQIGIDITTNSRLADLDEKLSNMRSLQPSYKRLGVSPFRGPKTQEIYEQFGLDRVMVLSVTSEQVITPDSLLKVIKKALKSPEYVQHHQL